MKFQMNRHMKKCVAGSLAAIGILTAGFALNQAYADAKQEDQILDNIYIGDVAVGGMNEEEARQAVNAYIEEVQNTKFNLHVNDKSLTATAKQLGIEWENTGVVEEAVMIGKSGSLITRYKDKKDLEHEPKVLELSFGTDEEKIQKYLTKKKGRLNQEAVDGGLVRENGAFRITGGEEGIEVNVEKSAETIAQYITNDWDIKEASIELNADIVQPRGSQEELSKVKDVLGTFSTNYSSSSAGRAMNVANGCSRINGTLLYPGDEFSVYEAVSPFDAEHGYALAGSYENGTVVETYGGGICQVSTTLYNAAIRAELNIKERFPHSMIVTYVEPSMDAAIAGTYKDLKFTNNTDAPVYIEGITGGGIITFNIYGEETREAGREVVFESEIISESTPKTQIQGSASHNVGYVSVQQSAHVGKSAKLWKIVKVNGVEQSREEFNSSNYNASPKIIIVGTNTASAEARAYIQNAIASQNEGAIYGAAQTAAAIASRPATQQPQPEEPESPEEKPEENPAEEKPEEEQPKEEKPKEEKPKEEKPKEEKTKQDDTKKKEEKKTETKKEETKKTVEKNLDSAETAETADTEAEVMSSKTETADPSEEE